MIIVKMTNYAYSSPFYNKNPIMGSVLNNKQQDDFIKKAGLKLHDREEDEKKSQLSMMIEELREQEKKAIEAKRLESIAIRIARGERVTPDEEEELRTKRPEEYEKARQARIENETLKKKIENSKSLVEARQHIANHMGKELLAFKAKDASHAKYLKEGRIKIEGEILSGKLRINKGLDIDERDYQKRKAIRMGMTEKEYEERKKRGEITDDNMYDIPTIDVKI